MLFLTKSKNKVSSRRQIQIKEVRDGILVLPGNEYRVILETSSINFELKSEDEQDAIIDGFENFLNSLPTPLQILIRVREIDIEKYLEQITKVKDEEREKVYRQQLNNYSIFIKNLVAGNKILSRRFYVVIPYKSVDRGNDFQLIREQINLNRDIVVRGLEKLGMKTKILGSLEILDLFYSFYNPGQVKTQELKGEVIKTLLENK
jgi:hypothetical protein